MGGILQDWNFFRCMLKAQLVSTAQRCKLKTLTDLFSLLSEKHSF